MRTFAVLVSVLVATAGGCKSRSADPQVTSGSSVASGSAAATPGSGSAPNPMVAPTGSALKLPKGDGTPPKKSTGKLDQAMSTRLSSLDYEGFKKDVRFAGAHVLDVRYNTVERPTIGTQINVGACLDCVPMELDKWKAKTESLKQLFPKELRDRSDSIWDLGQTELNGQPMIYIYQFGHQLETDEKGFPASTKYSSAYFLFYNDGVNQIRVVTSYMDDPVPRTDLERLAPRQDLEKIAKAYMDAYTHNW